MRNCPHSQAQFCPLYWAAHEPGAGGCDDGGGDECAVARGAMNYQNAAARLRATHPRLVAECEFYEMRSDVASQIKRNMCFAGIH